MTAARSRLLGLATALAALTALATCTPNTPAHAQECKPWVELRATIVPGVVVAPLPEKDRLRIQERYNMAPPRSNHVLSAVYLMVRPPMAGIVLVDDKGCVVESIAGPIEQIQNLLADETF